jgi:hypothetical protein
MGEIFTVPLRTVKPWETVLPEDHNNKVDAIKELIDVAKTTFQYIVTWFMAKP